MSELNQQVAHSLDMAVTKCKLRPGYPVVHYDIYATFDFAPLLVLIDMMMDEGWAGVDEYADKLHTFAKVVSVLQRDRVKMQYSAVVTPQHEEWRHAAHAAGPYMGDNYVTYFNTVVGLCVPLPDGRFLNLWLQVSTDGPRTMTGNTCPLAFGQRWWSEFRERKPLKFLKRFLKTREDDE